MELLGKLIGKIIEAIISFFLGRTFDGHHGSDDPAGMIGAGILVLVVLMLVIGWIGDLIRFFRGTKKPAEAKPVE